MDIQLTLPKRWSELMYGQLEEIAKIFLKFQDKTEILTRCFLLFSGWKIVRWRMWMAQDGNYFFFRKKGTKLFCLTADLFVDLVKNLKWITDNFWVTSYVPAIEGFRTPHLLLYNIKVEQFLAADNYYNRFVEKGDVRQLNNLLASLYCDSFEKLDLNFASSAMGRRQYFRRFAAFLWFSGVKAWLKQKYPYVFSVSGEKEIIDPDTMIFNILSALNGGDITRNEKILKTPMHQAFYELNQKIENSKTVKHV